MNESQSVLSATQRNNFRSTLDILERRGKEASERAALKAHLQNELAISSTEKESNQAQFRALPRLASAMPLQWTRTGLFANFGKGQRRILEHTVLEGRSDYRVKMSGEELDMYDCDVFLHAIQLAQRTSVNDPIYFERIAFLRAIGRGKDLSTESYKRLHASMSRLANTIIFVEGHGDGEPFKLFDKLEWGQEKRYWIMMDPIVVSMFANVCLAYIDMQVRLRLKSPFAKYLQSYVSGHSIGVHRISWESLRKWSGSRGRERDFKRRALPLALRELEEWGVIKNWEIGDKVVAWVRIPHAKSKKK